MFRGAHSITIDPKGRFAMPAKHRDCLAEYCAGHVVITIDPDHCLLLYPLPDWEEIENKLKRLHNLDRRARSLQRLLLGHATELELDSHGRILLPPLLREFATLDRKAMLIGQGNKFELWDEDRWNSNRDQWLAEYAAQDLSLSADLESLSL